MYISLANKIVPRPSVAHPHLDTSFAATGTHDDDDNYTCMNASKLNASVKTLDSTSELNPLL